jgi:GxxExxY protein
MKSSALLQQLVTIMAWTQSLQSSLAPHRPALMSVIQKSCTSIIQQHRSGSTEAFYQRMLQVDLYHRGIPCLAEVDVFCMSGAVPVCVGRLDLEVDHSIILELKVAPTISPKHIQQLMKYVRARTLTGMNVTEAAVVCFTDKDTVEFHCLHFSTASRFFPAGALTI